MAHSVRILNAVSLCLACIVSTTASTAATTTPTPTPSPAAASRHLNQLIVEFAPGALQSAGAQAVTPMTAAQAADHINADSDKALARRLAGPKKALHLMTVRYSDEALSTLDSDDPVRHLQNSVILYYPDDETTSRAVMVLANDPAVVSVTRDVAAHYSTDPLIPVAAGGAAYYQWGLYTLNVQPLSNTGVWAQTRGSAYTALLDNGIQTVPSVHEDLAGNFRKQFAYNYGYLNNGACGVQTTSDDVDENPGTSCNYDYAGHGTHTAGLLAARNGNGLGGAGVCPSCSLMVGRISQYDATQSVRLFPSIGYVASGLSDMSLRGVQVISNSFGADGSDCTNPSTDVAPLCTALATTYARDVVVVAASGNQAGSIINSPANLWTTVNGIFTPGVIAVGGVKSDGTFWAGSPGFGSNWSADSSAQQFVAPAVTAISSVYTNKDWNPGFSCGDNFPGAFMPGYGDCTGTSMASPHVAGIVGLMRSVDPLKSRLEVRNILAATSNTTQCTDSKCELGVPNAAGAVTAALGGSNVLNRTSPLFTFYSSAATDHFYTYVPQMAMAAMTKGMLRPQPNNGTQIFWTTTGATIPQYPKYPTNACNQGKCSNTPRHIAVVFTTHVNPLGGPELVPLYRMSYKCGDELLTTPPNPANPICSTNPAHLSHFYSTDPTGVSVYTGYDLNGVHSGYPGLGYKLDGIEGFIFSTSMAQPSGTVKLCRKYDASRDDYVLFPSAAAGGTDCSATTDGYTGGNYNMIAGGMDWIGWVYAAGTAYGSKPTSNNPPTVSITSPANNTAFPVGASVAIQASASDSDGSIASVRFFANEQLIGILNSPPYGMTWSNPPSSNNPYVLTAVAVDNRGAVTASAGVSITVGALPTIGNASFEVPPLFPGTYQYNPSGGTWTFAGPAPSGGSGISANNSAFTDPLGNQTGPLAPDGAQVAFIQGNNPISQVLNFSGATVHFKFKCAQRIGNYSYLQIQFKLDGVPIGAPIQPPGTTYTNCVTQQFVTSGQHTVTFLGVNDPGDHDNTVFLDKFQILSP